MSRELAEFTEETQGRDGAMERVLDRVLESVDAPSCGALIRELPASIPGAEARLMARLRRSRCPARAPGWLVAPALTLVAAGALLTLPVTPAPEGAPPASLSAALEGTGGLSDVVGLTLSYQGSGQLGGVDEAPVIHWSRGRIRVEVDPGQGMDLELVTDEGTVRVLGTVFTVERDALGTRVRVERGMVAVDCAGAALGAESPLVEDQRGLCLPVTAAGLLGRGRALLERGAPALALESADAGQRLAASGDLDWRELQALRIQALLADGQLDGACEAARGYPDDASDPRAAELEAILSSAWCVGGGDR